MGLLYLLPFIKRFPSGMFRDVGWQFVTDVSGHLTHLLRGGSLHPLKAFCLFPNQDRECGSTKL